MSDHDPAFRRIIYSSDANGGDLIDILRVSRANNGIDGISGLLLAKGAHYVQVLEGPPDSVSATFERIRHDDRHGNIVVLSDAIEEERAFGDWAMAGLPGEQDTVVRQRLSALLRNVPGTVRDAFATA